MSRVYTVEIGGPQMSTYEDIVYTLSAAKNMATNNSDADWCNVYRNDVLISAYRRDHNGNGNRWYKAQI